MSSEHASIDPPYLRQHLMAELDRLDGAIRNVQAGRPSERAQRLLPLETRRARVLDALRRLAYGEYR